MTCFPVRLVRQTFLSICIAVTLSFSQPSTAAEPTEESVRELLTFVGAADMGEKLFSQMMDSLNAQRDNALPEQSAQLDRFIGKMKEVADFDELVGLIIPVYQTHLTQDAVDAAIAFYQSEHGRVWVEQAPIINQKSFQIGQLWGQKMAEKVQQELKAEQQ